MKKKCYDSKKFLCVCFYLYDIDFYYSSIHALLCVISTIFLESFTLTFLAEWGDRSQLTTIMLAARENIYGVIIGTILGHAFCTGIAVISGRLIATQISVRTGNNFRCKSICLAHIFDRSIFEEYCLLYWIQQTLLF